MTHSSIVVCFSGRIGSGKSSVTEALQQALGWKRAGFGDYLRQLIAESGGDPNSRKVLQDLGQSLVESEPDAFCGAVLASGRFRQGEPFLLDGIRHVNIYRLIGKLVAPSQVRLIHLEVDDAHVRDRVAERPDGTADLARAERHRVEADLSQSLPHIADVVLDANQPLMTVVHVCLDTLLAFGVQPESIASARRSL
jgi:dephospho-CoA kinase